MAPHDDPRPARRSQVDRAILTEALAAHARGDIDLERLCRLMIRFGEGDDGLPPAEAMAALLRGMSRQTAPRRSPRATTRRLRAPAHRAPTPAPAPPRATPLARFAAERGATPAVHPGLSPADPRPSGPGDERYALGRLLGEGGVGQVRLAVDRDLRRPVAIKVLREEHGGDPILLQAFLEEAIITGGLEHPNIVPIHEVGVSADLGPYYVMKRLDGAPLSDILSGLRRDDPSVVARWGLGRLVELFAQTLRAVAFAHDHGVIHCDLKPANIIVGRYGDVTVVDWGLAKVRGAQGRVQARAQLWSGSPGYMAPEQALSQDIDALDERADVWSLGAILYELLTLTLPQPAATASGAPDAPAWQPIVPPSARAPSRWIPPELERLCLTALERDPSERHGSVHDLLAGVEAWLEGTRERSRRRARAEDALTAATGALAAARPYEVAIDAIQARPGADDGGAADHDLATARWALLDAYEVARDAILEGLALNPEGAGLRRAAAALYWYTFQRIWPATRPAGASLRGRAVPLLASLAAVALDAIVARAERKLAPLPPAAEAPDRWLAGASALGHRLGARSWTSEMVGRVRALAGAAIFAGTPSHELLAVAAGCRRADFVAGAELFRVGDPGDAVFIVLSGAIEIVRAGRVLTTLSAGACFGEVALIEDHTRTAAARAAAPTTCLVLTAERFRAVVADNSAIGWRVMRVLARRLRAATEREAALVSGR